jgi:plastocyanin
MMRVLAEIGTDVSMILSRAALVVGSTAMTIFVLGCGDDVEVPPAKSEPVPAVTNIAVFGKAPASIGGFASVVSLEPKGTAEFASPTDKAWVGQYGTEFSPAVLVARVGQVVEFSNDEDVVHNVHAIHGGGSGDTAFNVTTFKGIPYLHTFESAGVYRLSCGIHPAMLSFVVITPSPYSVLADDSGDFRLDDVPPGVYELVVWNADLRAPVRRSVEIGEAETDLGSVGG